MNNQKKGMLDQLRRIAATVSERRGWDFSAVCEAREPVPWDYAQVVRRYLQPSSHVLDVGTGGGERFLALAHNFDSGVGVDVDPRMVEVARENTPAALRDKVSFQVMRAEALQFADATFDLVLNRHSAEHAGEVVRLLRPGGYFITQQVGARNTHNICTLFGCGPGGSYAEAPSQTLTVLADAFQERGCRIICRAAYDVRYWFLDLESLIFWHQAIPLPEDFDIEKYWRQVAQIISTYRTPRGIETNEHRELLIVQKPEDGGE